MAAPAARPGHEAEAVHAFLRRHGIPEAARLLDVPCGIARRAFGLAEHGYHVTAVDPNEIGIEGARARIPEALAPRLRLLARPREALPGLEADETFEGILCLDHALGRGSEEEDVAFLSRLWTHARPDGLLAVDLLHRDFFTSRPRPFVYHVVGSLEQHEVRSFDPVAGVLELRWTFYERVGENLRHRMDSTAQMRLLAPHEARALLERAGWRVESVHGGWEDEAVNADRRRIVLAARPAPRG